MTPIALGPLGGPAQAGSAPELVAASLLTSDRGAELQLVASDGRRLRLAADEPTARALATTLWRALDRGTASEDRRQG